MLNTKFFIYCKESSWSIGASTQALCLQNVIKIGRGTFFITRLLNTIFFIHPPSFCWILRPESSISRNVQFETVTELISPIERSPIRNPAHLLLNIQFVTTMSLQGLSFLEVCRQILSSLVSNELSLTLTLVQPSKSSPSPFLFTRLTILIPLTDISLQYSHAEVHAAGFTRVISLTVILLQFLKRISMGRCDLKNF